MAWTTGSALLQLTADTLEVDIASLPALWGRDADTAVEAAYQALLGIIPATGYSASQMAASDQGPTLNLRHGLFILSGFGKGFADYDKSGFEQFDMVKDITERIEKGTFILTVSGTPIAPDGTSAVGGVSHGQNTAVRHAQCAFNRLSGWYGGNWGLR